MRWDDQPVGTWALTQFVRKGNNGACEDLGIFRNFREATEAARRIAKISKLEGGFHASYKRSDKREGASVDGFTQFISLDPPAYSPHIELTLSDGRTLWLEDLERELDEAKTAAATFAALAPLQPEEVSA